MPRVSYMIPMQGFRPKTNAEAALRSLRGLRGLGDSNTFSGCVQGYDANSNPVDCNDATAVVWMDVNGNTVAAGTSSGSASGPVAGVPTGSYLLYSAQWPITLSKSLDTVMQSVISYCRTQGISITNSQPNVGLLDVHSFPIKLQALITGAGFAQPNDVRSIIDHACYLATGSMPYSSSISVTSLPATAQAGQAAAQGYTAAPTAPGVNPQPATGTSWGTIVTIGLAAVLGGIVLEKFL